MIVLTAITLTLYLYKGWVLTSYSSPEPHRGTEYGQLLEGAGRANFDWFKRRHTKFAAAFFAERTDTITRVEIPWRTTPPGYGAGDFGSYCCTLQTNSADNLPSGTVIARNDDIRPGEMMRHTDDAPLAISLRANLTKGKVYYLVFENTHPMPEANWSSINTMMTRPVSWKTWTTSGSNAKALAYQDGAWRPWNSKDNPWKTQDPDYDTAAHVALAITWKDGAVTGSTYWSAASETPFRIWKHCRLGQSIYWKHHKITVTGVGVPIGKIGSPSGVLSYHIENVTTGEIVSGVIARPADVREAPGWVFAPLHPPVTLNRGKSYRLWLSSPDSDEHNCYIHFPVYTPGNPAHWRALSWGGERSTLIHSEGERWTPIRTHDMTFSLRTATHRPSQAQ